MRLQRNNRPFNIRNGFGDDYKMRRLSAWGDLAHSWIEYTQGDTFHLKAHEKLSEMVLLIKEIGPASIIDLGCGPGHFLQLLKSLSSWRRIVGIDFCHKMLKIADAMDMSQAHRVEWRHADLELPINQTTIFNYKGFDVATAVFLMDEVEDVSACFASATSVLREGGHLICGMLDVNREIERYELRRSEKPIVMSKDITVGGQPLPGQLFRVLRPQHEIIEAADVSGLTLRLNEVISPKALTSRSSGPALRIMAWQKVR